MIRLLIIATMMSCYLGAQGREEGAASLSAGFRASRVLSSYPNRQFPSEGYWANTGKTIAADFQNAQPAAVWIVSLYLSDGYTQLNFPSSGISLPYVYFIGADQNESYLNRFDQEGFKVWLQVEPGAANIDTLIYIVLNRYKHHPCVAGFGIDVEWYNTHLYAGGKKVTNDEASRWEQRVKAINPSYSLFLKHYGQSWMPPNFRGDILFVDDSQDFNFSSNPFNAMVNEFKSWGQKFSPNPVAFQYGYPADKIWWSAFSNPNKTIGQALLNNIPNCKGLFWVDFTITQLYPITSIEIGERKYNNILSQNYPNPFSRETVIRFQAPASSSGILCRLSVYDILGNEVAVLTNKPAAQGENEVIFDPVRYGLSTGVYTYKLECGGRVMAKKLAFIR